MGRGKNIFIVTGMKWVTWKSQLCVLLCLPRTTLLFSMDQQVLVSQVSKQSWSFLQCTGSNFQEPRIPKQSHHALPLSLIMYVISVWDIWEFRQHKKFGRWKTHEEGKRMISKVAIWFASLDSPGPWNAVQKPSVRLFVLWRSPKEPAERARWHRPAYRCRRDNELPQLWKNSQVFKKYPIQETETTQGPMGKAKSRF